MNWLLLVVAGIFEICWAVGMKYSHGFTRPLPALFTVVTMLLSFGGLMLAVRGLPLGTAYAVWTGIGTVGSVAAGIVLFGESASPVRLFCLALVVCGIVGLRFFAPR